MWQAELQLLREDIDRADAELVGVLERRFRLTRRVGELKRQHRQPPLDPARGPGQITAFVNRAEAAGIDKATAEALFRVIYDRVGEEHRQAQADQAAGGTRWKDRPMTEDPVLIVGGGPVGMTAALGLARQGIPVRIFEAAETFPSDPRASSIHPSSLDMLEELGLEDAVMAQGLPVHSWQFWDRVEGPVIELGFEELRGHTNHPFRLQLEQHNLSAIIEEALQAYGIAVEFGSRVTAVSQTDTSVEATIETKDGVAVAQGRYLVGADGGRSTVRKHLGVSFEGYSLNELFVVVTTAYNFAPHGYANACHFADPDEWATLFRVPNMLPDGSRQPLWRISMPANRQLDEQQARDFDHCSERLAILLPEGVRPAILHSNLYGIHQRVAGQFRIGRVLLAGDAAHVNGPTGAMGMNFGIQDAVFAAQNLGRVYANPGDETPLDRYDRQRRPLAEAVLQKAPVEIKARLELRDPAARRARNEAMRDLGRDGEKRLKFLLAGAMIDSVRTSAAIE